MILDQYFERIFIISLPRNSSRLDRCLGLLSGRGLTDKAVVQPAIDGSAMPPSAWWRAGGGAWGCYLSHVHVLQRAHIEKAASVLILEDDVIWRRDAAQLVSEFMSEVPADWGQLYLGGQHSVAPSLESSRVYRCRSVNRTHAYAVSGGCLGKLHAHVTYAPDYIKSTRPRHIDHQLEVAHRRSDWPVYSPSWWLAGQGQNKSQVNGRQHPDKWWNWMTPQLHKLPVVLFEDDPSLRERHFVHFGWAADSRTGLDPEMARSATDRAKTTSALLTISREAADCWRLPAVRAVSAEHVVALRAWLGARAVSAEVADLPHLVNYPANGLIDHPWIGARACVS